MNFFRFTFRTLVLLSLYVFISIEPGHAEPEYNYRTPPMSSWRITDIDEEEFNRREKRIRRLFDLSGRKTAFWLSSRPKRSWLSPVEQVQDIYGRGLRFMDKTHGKFSETLIHRVSWFDGFFGDTRISGDQVGYFRLKHTLEMEESEGITYRPRFKAKVDLPNLERRLKLVFGSEEENEFRKGVTGSEDGITLNERGDNFITSALRWSFLKRQKLNIDSSVGMRFSFPLSPYARLRYRQVYDWGSKWDFVFNETLFAFLNDESGATTRFDIERSLGKRNLIRFATQGTLSDESDGIDWLQGVGYFHRVSFKTAVSFHASMSGYTDPQFQANNYNFGVRFRQQFLRKWLFYEIVPEVGFDRDDDWDIVNKVTIGLEVVMGNVNRFLGKDNSY